MFRRKSTIIATVFIAFMYLVFVPLVSAATEYKMADYWPFKEGSWWEFNEGKIEITGTEEINGINTFIYVDSGSCSDGTELNVFNDDTNGFGFISQSEDGSDSMVKFIEPYVKKGDKTTASFGDTGDREQTILVFQLKGIANVVVPAGTFKRCLVFSVKVKARHTDGTYSYATEKLYFAKGVGLVKVVVVKQSTEEDCFLAINGRELEDYSN